MRIVIGAFRLYPRFAAMGLISLCSLACGRVSAGGGAGAGAGGGAGAGAGGDAGEGPGGSGQTGGGANAGAGTAAGGGAGMPGDSSGGPKLRLLTQSEYTNALSDLLGAISTPLVLPSDTAVAGFVSIGGSEVSVNASAVCLYEVARRAARGEGF